MGILTLIKTLTADGDSALSFVDGTASVVLDSTYDEYMFVFTDINPATDSAEFSFQANVAGGSGYNEAIVTSLFRAQHDEANSDASMGYSTAQDQVGTAFQGLGKDIGNGSDESLSGILHLFSPSSTTYVTHFYSRTNFYHATPYAFDVHVGGYFNLTGAIDEIQFKMDSGDFDGVIQLYGIA